MFSRGGPSMSTISGTPSSVVAGKLVPPTNWAGLKPALAAAGFRADPVQNFFLERYADAYRIELSAFIEAVEAGTTPPTGIEDAIAALRLAEAAWTLHARGRLGDAEGAPVLPGRPRRRLRRRRSALGPQNRRPLRRHRYPVSWPRPCRGTWPCCGPWRARSR